MRRIFVFLLFCAVVACAFVWLVPRGPRAETFVEIAPGTPSREIALELEKQHLIWSRYAFEALRIGEGGTLKAGEYRFDHPMRLKEVYGRLLRGDVYTVSVTIPEGANVFDIAQRVEAAHLGSRAGFLKAATADVGLVRDLDPGARSLEGYLFPDTYRFPRIAKPEQMVAVMVKRFRVAAAEAGLERGEPGSNSGGDVGGGKQGGKTGGDLGGDVGGRVPGSGSDSVHRVVTLASLVERETPIEAERPVVASVFVNRLGRGMALMTDPSVIYAALLEGRYRGAIFQSDLASNSAYNTYKHAGLPPGPICNPGLASLKAAVSPAATRYLYFVAATADPTGHSRFAETLEEHTRNVQAYRRSVGSVGAGQVRGQGRR